jgi:Ca2+-binding EF-hand superfamily protein
MSRFPSLILAGLLAGGLAATPVAAQVSSPPPLQPSPSQDAARGTHPFLDRFNAANTSHDGRLTLQQAQAAHMPWVAHNFAAIDAEQKGYITVQDIRAYRQQLRAASSGPAPSQDAAPGTHPFLNRFNAANTSRDGRLTLSQAQAAHMSWVAQNFAAIDVQQKGYITVQDVQTYRQRLRAAPSGVN